MQMGKKGSMKMYTRSFSATPCIILNLNPLAFITSHMWF